MPQALGLILNDDGYRVVEQPHPGDIVVYRGDGGMVEHVGLVLQADQVFGVRQILVLSKWGGDGEYIHREEDVPDQLGRPVEYWTERVGP